MPPHRASHMRLPCPQGARQREPVGPITLSSLKANGLLRNVAGARLGTNFCWLVSPEEMGLAIDRGANSGKGV
ncbi:hypothetical protein ACVWY3_002254 [Bradyrhizobium sp. USDA 4486]